MKKIISCCLLSAGVLLAGKARAISLEDIQIWAGSGTNRAALVIDWSVPRLITNSTVPAPITDKTLVWGYRFNGSKTATDMLGAVLSADPRLYAVAEFGGSFVVALGYNLAADGVIGITDGSATNHFSGGLLSTPTVDMDAARALNPGDLYWGGYDGPNWEVWTESGDLGGFLSSPDRGTNAFWTPDDTNNPFSGRHGQWEYPQVGLASLILTNGSWIGFSVAAGADIYTNNNDPSTIAYSFNKHAPPSPDGTYAAYVVKTNDFAVQIVASSNVYSSSPYDAPAAVLGPPTRKFLDYFTPNQPNVIHRGKIVEPPYWTDPAGNDVITEINPGGQITVNMGRKVYDDPNNPYGTDFVVYGNSFYVAAGYTGFQIDDFTDEGLVTIPGGSNDIFGHATTVAVSQDGTTWFTYPTVQTILPDNAYRWDDSNHAWTDEPMNQTKPLNPALNFPNDITVADALDQYNNASGGSGYDLKLSGLPWIQYVRVIAGAGLNDTNDANYTVIDSIAAVNPIALGDTLTITPSNLVSGATNIVFQKPGDLSQTLVSLGFQSLSDIAKLSAVPLSDLSSFAPVPGVASSAYQIQILPVTGTNAVTSQADVRLRAASTYNGTGADLRAYEWSQSNWVSKPFLFNPASGSILLFGVANPTAFVVSQIIQPRLQAQWVANTVQIQFVPVPNAAATLERSADLKTWAPIATLPATNAASVTLLDNAPLPDQAFYRLNVNVP